MARPKESNAVLPDVPEQLSDDEIKSAFKGHCDSSIMRGLIDAEIQYIRSGGPREVRTLRGFWYQVIKSALSRSCLLNKETSKGNEKDWAAVLSDQLEDMVSAGVTTYEELQIIDGSRQRAVAHSMTHTVAQIQWTGPHYPWIIIFTEKDTIWPALASVAQLYGVSFISCGGQPAASCTEDILKQIVRSETFKKHLPKAIYLLGITDYDPYGYHIFDAQADQVMRMFPRIDLGKAGLDRIEIESLRLGVLPSQLDPAELNVKTYAPKREGLTNWVKRTGGVNGKPLGIELDALPVQAIRLLLADAIEKRISLDPRREDLRLAFVEELAWETLMPKIEIHKKRLMDTVRASHVWETIQNAPIKPDAFRNAALEGHNAIDPMSLFDCKDEVLAAMNKVKLT